MKSRSVIEINHPLVQHKMSLLRDEKTGPTDFRALVDEITLLVGYEATRDMPLKSVNVRTPLAIAKSKKIAGGKPCIVPIFRAGLGMVQSMLQLMPTAKVGHIGLYRDHDSFKPVNYYCKLPLGIKNASNVFVLDPMLATGGSASDAITLLKQSGAKHIKLLCLVASKYGIKKLLGNHPDIQIYCAAIDGKLNAQAYIVPGLGDAGDRLYGTK
jgi:uracil phosphoribosyltransferase